MTGNELGIQKQVEARLVRGREIGVQQAAFVALASAVAILTHAGVVGFEQVAAVVLAGCVGVGQVQALFGVNGLAHQHQAGQRLVAEHAQYLREVGTHGVGQRLHVVRVGRVIVFVLVSKGTDVVDFALQVEVADTGHVDVLEAGLYRLLVAPPAIASPHLADFELVEHHLPIQLGRMKDIPLEVEAQNGVVGRAHLLLHGAVEDDRVQVLQLQPAPGATGNLRLKHANIQVRRHIEAEVVQGHVLLRIHAIDGAAGRVVGAPARELGKQVLVVQLPDAGVEFQEEVWRAVVRQNQRAVAVADEVAVVPQLHVDVLGGGVGNVAPGREEIVLPGAVLKRFPVALVRHNGVAGNAVLHVLRHALLVVGQKRIEAQALVDGAFHLHAARVHVANAVAVLVVFAGRK